MKSTYDFTTIEEKWSRYWVEQQVFATKESTKEKRYILDMFPYPSGSGLHVGHAEGYTATDVLARFERMRGYNVLHPIGWDAFGLPAENYAIKQGTQPDTTTKDNIANYKKQIQRLGFSYSWPHELATSDPAYYRWTQWMFLQLFNKGLAYQAEANVNWCEHDQTVLANEQVIDGKCERCGNNVLQRSMKQWFFKITAYAEELLTGLDDLDWPDSIKASQRNWIGKSTGSELTFKIAGHDQSITVFTTRPDTLYGVTYVVLAPEHPLVNEITTDEQREAVQKYQQAAQGKSELTRAHLEKDKTGVFTGAYAIHPITGEQVPVWVADYVLMQYGTGAVMAVPAHDERDFAFAQKFDLPIKGVITGYNGEEAYIGEGEMINSAEFDGMSSTEAKAAITTKANGQLKTTYRLRDWLISRQRYWGAPIPIVHCDSCGAVAVPADQLPVELPEVKDFRPHGHSPLADVASFVNTTCPQCGGPAKRETDTMDTFVCSSWYFLRYPSIAVNDKPFGEKETADWLPVDTYVGGAEHAVLHLLYARFFTKFLRDEGHLSFAEPFTRLRNVGLILGPDHAKMSKSKGNVVNPDEVIAEVGADALRLHELFMGPFSDEKPWNTESIKGVRRFLDMVWKTGERVMAGEGDQADEVIKHATIKKVTEDTAEFRFNTAISALMTWHNTFAASTPNKDDFGVFLILLNPYAPHMTAELWQKLGYEKDIAEQSWPEYDATKLVASQAVVSIQVNGKLRGTIEIAVGEDEAVVVEKAKNQPNVARYLEQATLKKTIYIKDRLVNLVVSD